MKLDIKNLSKQYGRGQYGLKNYSLELESGILGLLGPNGAGKSTLLKMIATISRLSEGAIYLNGTDIASDPDSMRAQLGYLPQDFGVYPNLNAFEFLHYMAAMKGVGGPHLKERIHLLLESLNLIEHAKRAIGTYSGGMKQRVGIAQALLNNPKVILLDEPTVGLDPQERVGFRNLISELANDAIVILSSHIVSDIDTIADEVAIMKDGELLVSDHIEGIISNVHGKVLTQTMDKASLTSFKSQYTVINTMRKGNDVSVRYIDEHANGYATANANATANVPATLEDAYLYLTKKN